MVGATLEDRDESLANLRPAAADRRPGRAAPRRWRLLGGGSCAAPVERMRQTRGRDCAEPASGCGAAGRRRAPPPRDDTERDARPPRGRDRARAALRRRREPRAPDAARPPQDRARGRAALRGRRGGASGGDRLGRSRRWTAWPSSRTTCWSSPAPARKAWRWRRRRLMADELLETVAERFEARVRSADRSLRSSAEPGLVVRGDRLRLEQALTNLVENALRHGAGRDRARRRGARARGVRLHVRDEGVGFDAGVPRASVRALQPRRRGPRRAVAPASASRSSRRSPAPTAAGRGSRRTPSPAPRSGSSSRHATADR